MSNNTNHLNEIIISMAKKRGLNKTFCPSEIARQLALKENHWRSLIESVRLAATELIDKGQLVCKQHGEIVDIRTAKGPIRLQIASD
ncbi:unnamed protein product [Rotaria sordida]|uniref:DUF3253 domain-containing protein n=1 Tax=Rotaria sordida TaxID=392033 RepID=A0A818JX93_9BILA|nr:unnamed protein product [Rotaria sordida]CAF0879546.1 unnamed protein product [Rotaria sordida]CAF0886499.1 unnamed protein product [Rotaria sordida]CAF0898410.1 unnamed protein product [Rotaria sordida]CAF0906223.1 unnamed protein product [Rotaria sordida]